MEQFKNSSSLRKTKIFVTRWKKFEFWKNKLLCISNLSNRKCGSNSHFVIISNKHKERNGKTTQFKMVLWDIGNKNKIMTMRFTSNRENIPKSAVGIENQFRVLSNKHQCRHILYTNTDDNSN